MYKKIYKSVLAHQELSSRGGKTNSYTDTEQNQPGSASEWRPLELCVMETLAMVVKAGELRGGVDPSGLGRPGRMAVQCPYPSPSSLLLAVTGWVCCQWQRVGTLVTGLVKRLKKEGTSMTGIQHSCIFLGIFRGITPSWPAGPSQVPSSRLTGASSPPCLPGPLATSHFSNQLCDVRDQSSDSFSKYLPSCLSRGEDLSKNCTKILPW